ncbi:unnamed protein product [Pieris brassicae]|uniref:Uncharacterized protein n=1 Tax=Pieris brassicae TaxID=7116 RepID=A0A9P0SSF0_PIEBR|nr:unnamed protein product [Pieris brassicae]
MLSKFLCTAPLLRPSIIALKVIPASRVLTRNAGHYIPPTQYDVPIPRRLHLTYVLRVYWETIPLFLVTCTSFALCIFSIYWASNHKADVVYTTHTRESISRTMDLRNPDVLKLFVIHQRYEPWPEMQDVLDKMNYAQKTAIMRARICKPS